MTNGLLDGFTSHWLRRESSHETAGRKTHRRYAVVVASREFGAESENKSRSITRGLEVNKIRPKVKFFG
jgi:hypothetical protein